jgi:hypothetical protein
METLALAAQAESRKGTSGQEDAYEEIRKRDIPCPCKGCNTLFASKKGAKPVDPSGFRTLLRQHLQNAACKGVPRTPFVCRPKSKPKTREERRIFRAAAQNWFANHGKVSPPLKKRSAGAIIESSEPKKLCVADTKIVPIALPAPDFADYNALHKENQTLRALLRRISSEKEAEKKAAAQMLQMLRAAKTRAHGLEQMIAEQKIAHEQAVRAAARAAKIQKEGQADSRRFIQWQRGWAAQQLGSRSLP